MKKLVRRGLAPLLALWMVGSVAALLALSPALEITHPALQAKIGKAIEAGLDKVLEAGTTTAHAQERAPDGFPETRVRMIRDASHFPDRYYPDNRVILRKVELQVAGQGMALSGSVITDFEADIIPGSEAEVQRGQQQVSVDLFLVHFATSIKRRGGIVQDPKVTYTPGANIPEVPTQRITLTVTGTSGMFGAEDFALPPLDRPLAPGVYALVARVHFQSQPASVQKAIKWCSDWYGQIHDGEDENLQPKFKRVLDDPGRHEDVYQELMNVVSKAESVCYLHVGETLNRGRVELTAPGRNVKSPNYVAWTPHHVAAENMMDWEYQFDNAEAVVKADLDAKKKLERKANPPKGMSKAEYDKEWEDLQKKYEADAEADIARIKRENANLIKRWGGKTSKPEQDMVRIAKAARSGVLEQIARFEGSLSVKYWELGTGHLMYGGYWRVNTPGYNCWYAVSKGDLNKLADERKDAWRAFKDLTPEQQDQITAKREKQWEPYPEAIRKSALAYLKAKESTDVFDASKYCTKSGAAVVLDKDKWHKYRLDFIKDLMDNVTPIINEITTTNRYANQVWPEALRQAEAARDIVVSISYAYEYYTRTVDMKQDKAVVLQDWRTQSDEAPLLKLDRYFVRAQSAPVTLRDQFNNCVTQFKDMTGVPEIEQVWKAAFAAGGKPPD